ncbi:MAG TPA: UDP-N-acetylmuramate dehydrogenase [Blastocatellia bacterium]|nr:UDP-N-acetylmuramate dehydrogenase [Blastocatellia bacterium]
MIDRKLIQENISLAPFTTFRIGGPARYFAEICNESEMIEALDFAEQKALSVFILGGGSNILVADEGFQGIVLRIAIKGISSESCDGQVTITAGAGEEWDDFVALCVKQNLGGVECLSGIPGLVGGTPVQNVGAYGQEVSETITRVRVLDRREKRIVELSNADCRFDYRRSIFNSSERERYIVLSVTYVVEKNKPPAIRYPDVKNFFAARKTELSLQDVRDAVRIIRSRKAMLITPDDPDCQSAGSFFKNPIISADEFENLESTAQQLRLINVDEQVPRFKTSDDKIKVPAAWLIERAGFQKSYQKGRAGISSKHTLALVNLGGASAKEIITLATEIQSRVREVFNITLFPEPLLIGFEPSCIRHLVQM